MGWWTKDDVAPSLLPVVEVWKPMDAKKRLELSRKYARRVVWDAMSKAMYEGRYECTPHVVIEEDFKNQLEELGYSIDVGTIYWDDES